MLTLATKCAGKPKAVKASRNPGSYYKLRCYGFRIRIGGQNLKAYTLADIANIFGKHRSTIYRWYQAEWLPPPAIRLVRRYRGRAIESPIYIYEQLLLIRRAINDLNRNQQKQFRKTQTGLCAWMRYRSYWICKNFYADSPLPEYCRPESEEF